MTKQRALWIATALLALCFGVQVMSARLKSPTYDEQGYIARGYAYVSPQTRGDLHIRIGTPVGLNAWNALPLLVLPDLRLPVESPSWSGTDFHPIAERFLWHVNPNADQIVFLDRLPTMALTLLMAAFVFRWARALYGPWGGLLAVLLCALDPNLIAHGRLATTDLGSTALMFLTTYWAWRFAVVPRWRFLVATGLSLGLAQVTKFSALAYLPILAGVLFLRAWTQMPFALTFAGHSPLERIQGRQRWWSKLFWLGVSGVLICVLAGMAIWAVYGFEVGPVPALAEQWPGLPAWVARLPLPAPSHLDQLLDLSGRLAGEAERLPTSFLLGELYPGGRWEYFPIAFLVKTPIPTLILLAGALVLAAIQTAKAVTTSKRSHVRSNDFSRSALWLPPLIYFGISLRGNLNLGYRYLLPILPYLYVLAAQVAPWLEARIKSTSGARRTLLAAGAAALILWSAWSGLAIYPDYLAYFNEFAGGPDNGWRILVDSNLDWGQDLKGLKVWMEEHDVDRVKLGYLGEAYPSYYGIVFDPLPSWPDRWQHPHYHDLYPSDPAPGTYAISANLVQGRNLVDPETYAWFRSQTPVDKVGYSIFIYDVPPRGSGRAALALSGLALADVRSEDYARLGTNDVRVLWFDARRAVVSPAATTAYLAMSGETALHPALAKFGQVCEPGTTSAGQPLCLWTESPRPALAARAAVLARDLPAWVLRAASFAPGDPQDHGQRLAYPVQFGAAGGTLDLLAYETLPGVSPVSASPALLTYWRVQSPAAGPLKLFVHLLNAEGTYVAGEDRLDVWHDNWVAGDLWVQVHEVSLPADAAPGRYQVELGIYDPETMQRLPVMREGSAIADRVLLAPVQVE